jgi:hypothetical protein
MSRSRRGRRAHWYESKRLDWNDGYVILLRVQTALWKARIRDPAVQGILNRCRRAVLAELGYDVEPQRVTR